jgi:hypothetical protein
MPLSDDRAANTRLIKRAPYGIQIEPLLIGAQTALIDPPWYWAMVATSIDMILTCPVFSDHA